MDGVDNRFEKLLRNAIAKFRAESAADREKIYAAARASLKRVQRAGSSDAASLEAAIKAIEASFRPAAAAPASPVGRLMAIRAVAIPLACLVIGAGAGAYAASVWRIGLMGRNARPDAVLLVLAALEDVLDRG